MFCQYFVVLVALAIVPTPMLAIFGGGGGVPIESLPKATSTIAAPSAASPPLPTPGPGNVSIMWPDWTHLDIPTNPLGDAPVSADGFGGDSVDAPWNHYLCHFNGKEYTQQIFKMTVFSSQSGAWSHDETANQALQAKPITTVQVGYFQVMIVLTSISALYLPQQYPLASSWWQCRQPVPGLPLLMTQKVLLETSHAARRLSGYSDFRH